ncbi:MAG TPA: UbiA family prenyltransferase [Actinomycetes bacterium]|nr:UbiA family prenyltransferase [Actinomycetes bacterium]
MALRTDHSPYTLSKSPGIFHTMRLSWIEARPVVQFVFQLRFAAGTVLGGVAALGDLVSLPLALSAVGWLLATWTVYLVNGVADIVEDRENNSRRPIARGRLPRRAAATVCYVLAALAFTCCALVGARMAILVTLFLAVGLAYSTGPRPLKRSMVGFTASVTTLGLLTYLAGASAMGGQWCGPLFVHGVAMSLWMGLVGSTKDLSDTRGDRLAGRRTLPVVFGERRARLLMASGASAVGWGYLAAAAWTTNGLLPVATIVCAGSVAVTCVLFSPFSRGDRNMTRRPYRAFMVTQYSAHVALLAPYVVA